MKRDERIQQVENGLCAFNGSPLDTRTYPLAERMAKYRVPGVSVAVIKDGKLDWVKGYGVRSVTKSGAVNVDTLFQAGSISKPVAALAILRLFEARGLDLDTTINTYLQSWQVPPVGDWTPRITLRQLLSHTAGTTVHGFLGYNSKQAVPSIVQILEGADPANSDPVRVDTVPGTQMRYSGGGTTIAQLAASDISGQPFDEIAREWVLEPLGMTRSMYAHPLPEPYHRNAAHAHYLDGSHVEGNWYTMPELAAAGLWTTPTDIARFSLALQQAWRGKPGAISHQVARWMLMDAYKGKGFNMGMGTFLEHPAKQTSYFGHGGANIGYRNDFKVYFEGGSSGAAIMTNGDQGGYLVEEIFKSVAQVYGWRGYLPKPPEALENSPAPGAEFIGMYRLPSGVMINIGMRGDGRLVLKMRGQNALDLRALARDKYQAYPLLASVTFERGTDGSVTGLIFEQNGQRLTAPKA